MKLTLDKNATISYTTDPEGLNVTFVTDNSGVVEVNDNGLVTAIKEGTAHITINVGDNETYALNSTVITVTVSKIPTEILIQNETLDMEVGDVADPVVSLMPSNAGNLSFKVSDENVILVNGDGIVVAVGQGTATVAVSFRGNDKYLPSDAIITVTVSKVPFDIVIKLNDTTLTVEFPEDATGNATLIIGDETLVAPIKDGVAIFDLSDVPTYNGTFVDATVTVLPTVNGTDITKMFRNKTQYWATFLDSQGNYLPEGTIVIFNINGVMYERKVSGDGGLAKLNINLQAGEYVITATNTVTGENATNIITVLSKIVENADLTKYYRNETQYTVKILGDDGNPVGTGEIVKFNINGVVYERKTNESGIAKLTINLEPGDYVITAEYGEATVSNNIKVLPILNASDITMKYLDGTQFAATLVDGQGKPYAKQSVTFNVNGVFYNRETDSSGIAKLNIRLQPGEYIITSSYNGSNIANTIKITV